MTRNLEIAYSPFIASLLTGGFAVPDEGDWSADFVAAHIAINNNGIADAAEAVLRGEEAVYDNTASVDEDNISRYVEHAGGVVGLAEDIRRSAARLNSAFLALGERSATNVHVRIRDGKDIAYDGPMLIGAFMEGNATRHLEAHHEQLKALHGPWLSEHPEGFDAYQLILLARVTDRPDLDQTESDFLQRQHLGHLAKMRNAGYLLVAGPIQGDDEIAGIAIYRAGSVDEARILAQDDPAVRAGRLEVRASSWATSRDALVRP